MPTVAASGTKTPALGTITVTIASPAVFAYTAHGLNAGDAVVFATTGALPTGLVAGTTYYVIAAGLTANNFEVSATPGGSAVNTSVSQSGTHSMISTSVLFDSSAAATYLYAVDLTAMQAADQVVLTVYKMMKSGGNRLVEYYQQFNDSQIQSSRDPLVVVSGAAVVSIPASTGLADSGAIRCTLSQVAGTPRAFDWAVEKF